MLPLLATLIFQAAGGKSLGRLVTYVALPALLGPVLGPLIAGAILTHLSWRFMFWVNVPFCVIGILLAWRYLPTDRPPRPDPGAGQTAGRLLQRRAVLLRLLPVRHTDLAAAVLPGGARLADE
jgi:MFS family permease